MLQTQANPRPTKRVGICALLWLTWGMRVIASGNLTVELIRAQRFDVACRVAAADENQRAIACNNTAKPCDKQPVDKVLLSPQALASDPWAVDAKRVGALLPQMDQDKVVVLPEPRIEPDRLSPVVGSPALSGLGAAWVVPGTLLDVVA